MLLLLRRFGPVTIALALARAAMATREHWREIPPADRRRLRTLVGKSRGRPANLSEAEQQELLGLVRALRPARLLWRLVKAALLPTRRSRKNR
ncbi:MAG: hypothetical protein ACR2ND_05980 [Solirubrobacteraceae bacterium]